MVRKTRTPRFGIAASTTPRPRLVVPVAHSRGGVPVAVRKSGANKVEIEREFLVTGLQLLQEFQNLHHFFLVTKTVPSTQIPNFMRVLSRFPVISVTNLATDANVSRDTAKRWLVGLEKSGKLQVREFNGMKQYGYSAVLEILDRFVRHSAVP